MTSLITKKRYMKTPLKDISPKKNQVLIPEKNRALNDSTKGGLKFATNKGQTELQKQKNIQKARLKSALKTSSPRHKYDKALSVRWADEEHQAIKNNLAQVPRPNVNIQEDVTSSKNIHREQNHLSQPHPQKQQNRPDMAFQSVKITLEDSVNTANLVLDRDDLMNSVDSRAKHLPRFDSVTSEQHKMSLAESSVAFLDPEALKIFAESLKILLEQESELDQAKRDLFANPDFNIKKLYQLMDQGNQGFISFESFRAFIKDLGLKTADQDLLIDLFTSFDTNQDYSLTLEALSDMVFPYDRRVVREGHYNKKEFYRLTMRDITSVFEKQLAIREAVFKIKTRLAEKHVDLNVLFDELNQYKRKALTREDFLAVIERFDKMFFEVKRDEIDFVIKRCDLDSDGKINFRDFYLFFSV